MPKSRRAKVVHTTRTKSAGRSGKAAMVDEIQGAASSFKACYVFRCVDMRAQFLKSIRAEFNADSRFFFGKKNVMRVALGRNAKEAFREGLDKVAAALKGEVGLLFSNRKAKELEEFFKSFQEPEFARAGAKATSTEVISAGNLKDQSGHPFPSSMFEQFRALHLPLSLKAGILTLDDDYTICNEGDVLSPEQAQLLRLFGRKLAMFRIQLILRWRNGEVTKLQSETDGDDAGEEEEEEEEEAMEEDAGEEDGDAGEEEDAEKEEEGEEAEEEEEEDHQSDVE